MTALLLLTTLPVAGQKPGSASRPADKDFLPAGPFLFQPGAPHPIFLDAFKDRPSVVSPDGTLEITVTGPPKSLLAWVTVVQRNNLAPGFPFPVWPLEASGDVLWAPDSEEFALTDNRYANLSYVLVFSTTFRMGESEPGLGVPITDLTSVVRKAFEERARGYYAGQDFDTPLFYAKALQWIENDRLLVGLSARTLLANTPGSGQQTLRIRDWDLGYVVDVPSKKIVDELSEAQLLSRYGIKVAK
jgi:hypothetical protein